MGRYVDISITTTVLGKNQPKYTAANMGGTLACTPAVGNCLRYGGKSYYDGTQCWQYKVVLDRPGPYCWTVPTGVVCARTVIVGGGGKPKCGALCTDGNTSGCNSAAGAGGGYSDKCHAVTAGTTYFCIIVGRQEQDSTVSCNGVAVHTASGAAGCIPGAASGGDWNSRGGYVGYTCNQCAGSYSHCCGSVKYICGTNCCGYCITFQCDPSGSGSTCCNTLLAGGASAGSPRHQCGGCSSTICGYYNSAVSGGGAGIGQQGSPPVWAYNCCSCVCPMNPAGYYGDMCWNYPGSAQGGGGSGPSGNNQGCRSFQGCCTNGIVKGGDGGIGGPDADAGQAWTMEWGYGAYCAYPYGIQCSKNCEYRYTNCAPCRVDWWDIFDICGTGSPGTMFGYSAFQCTLNTPFIGGRPKNSGEGAGTGGIATYCCNVCQQGIMIGSDGGTFPLVNWTKLCQLGCCGWCDQAWLMPDTLFPFFITCAGTLGGSGGVGWCNYTSKAGKGGGGGQSRFQLLCVCWGGVYDCCFNGSQTAVALAFPPCLLDQMISNAGTGMAIIYYREA